MTQRRSGARVADRPIVAGGDAEMIVSYRTLADSGARRTLHPKLR